MKATNLFTVVIALIMGFAALPRPAQAEVRPPQSEFAGALCVILPAIGQGVVTLSALGARADAVRCPTYYTVRYGETLNAIAGRCGISAATLRQANGLTTSRLWTGQRLYIPAPKAPAAKPTSATFVRRAPAP
jgi:LysM repeat protein